MESKACSNYLRYVDLIKGDGLDRQNKWLNKNGFLQKMALSYEKLQARWSLFWYSLRVKDFIN